MGSSILRLGQIHVSKISKSLIPTLIAVGIIGYMLYLVWGGAADRTPAYCSCLSGNSDHYLPGRMVVARVAIPPDSSWSQLPDQGCRDHGVCFYQPDGQCDRSYPLGDFVRIFILKHDYNTTYSEGISSIVVERVFDIIAISVLGAVSLWFVPNVPSWFKLIIIVPLALGFGFLVFLIFAGKLTTQNRYVRFILTMLEEIRRASLSVRSMVILGHRLS